MLYLVVKALHVTALVAWMAGMIWLPLVLSRAHEGEARVALQQSFGRLTTPAMLVTLALGLWLGQETGWFRESWLQLKLGFVLALTGLHGLIAGQMRRLAADPSRPTPRFTATLPWAVLTCVASIALLAVVKPDLW
jgi:uncharacterized integral membrane protein (TIGR00701 family)